MLIPPTPGSYVLVIAATRATNIHAGRLGEMAITPGCYLYVGSALGSGGLAARLGHHFHLCAKPHWHVDALRAVADVHGAWWLESPERLEHCWALALAQAPGCGIPMLRFGASDCHCPAHLFTLLAPPSRPLLERLLSPPPDHYTVLNIGLTNSCCGFNPPGTAAM